MPGAAASSVRTCATKKAARRRPSLLPTWSAVVDGNELAQLFHLCWQVGFVGIELGIPFAQLIDGTIPFRQHREIHRALGAPDIHVLIEGVAVALYVLLSQRLILLIGPAGDLLHQHAKPQLELVW